MAPDDIRELFAGFAPVTVRRMFSGAGIYYDGIMFALVVRGVIYLKVDEGNAAPFERERLEPYSYTRHGKRAAMSYRRMPDRLYDDPEELAAWARDAFAAARRRQTGKVGSTRRTTSSRSRKRR